MMDAVKLAEQELEDLNILVRSHVAAFQSARDAGFPTNAAVHALAELRVRVAAAQRRLDELLADQPAESP
jgi:hypothetical protein